MPPVFVWVEGLVEARYSFACWSWELMMGWGFMIDGFLLRFSLPAFWDFSSLKAWVMFRGDIRVYTALLSVSTTASVLSLFSEVTFESVDVYFFAMKVDV